jgi:Chaperone of endosialidase
MPMPYMLAQEHMSYVDAVRYGTARNQATLVAALAAIGSTRASLVLTMSGDGVWTLTSSLTIPSNVLLWIPQGVSVFRSSGVTLTLQGPIVAWGGPWETGPGATVKSAVSSPVEINNLRSTVQTMTNAGVGTAFQYLGGTDPAGITMFINDGAGGAGIAISRNLAVVNSTWQLRAAGASGNFELARPGTNPILTVNNNGMGLGSATGASHLLHLFTGDAAMPGGGPWLNSSSDSRVKTVLSPFTDGLALLQQLTPVRYEYNGLAGTPAGDQRIGLVADAVQPIAPYMVFETEAYLHPDDPTPIQLKGLDTNPLTYLLINAVCELAARLESLEGPSLLRTVQAAPETEAKAAPAAPAAPHVTRRKRA